MRLLEPMLDLLFPPHCVACGAVGFWLCAACVAAIPVQRPPLCKRCGRSLSSWRTCRPCQRQPPPVDGLRSVAPHKAPLSQAIHALKYGGVRVLAEPLGTMMANYAIELSLPVDIIAPVPLHRARERQRGHNQSRLLATAMAVRLDLPLVDDLRRLRPTAAQVGLGRSERLANVRGAFYAMDASFAGRRVLLIDDVCTTGATLGACADALRRAGARSVWALTLARATGVPLAPNHT